MAVPIKSRNNYAICLLLLLIISSAVFSVKDGRTMLSSGIILLYLSELVNLIYLFN